MRNTILEEISKQKFTTKDGKYIQRLQQMLDLPKYCVKHFQDTGSITPIPAFLLQYTDTILHPKCTNVVTYIGGHYIQMLSDGKYFINQHAAGNILYRRGRYSKYLHKLELIIFNNIT